jgi:hypothetical protein
LRAAWDEVGRGYASAEQGAGRSPKGEPDDHESNEGDAAFGYERPADFLLEEEEYGR